MNEEELMTPRKLSDLNIGGVISPNIGAHAANHVSTAVDIAKSLPEDADEAAAILADAARFHAVIRDRKASAVFANVLSQIGGTKSRNHDEPIEMADSRPTSY